MTTGTDNDSSPVAVVTGSTSGIGRAIALRFAEAGYRVVLHGRQPSEQMDAVEKEILTIQKSNSPTGVEKIFGDFSQPTRWQEFVDNAWSKLGPVDCWVNNAGGDVLTEQWRERSIEEKLDYLWKTDVTASLMLSRLAGQRMMTDRSDASGGGHGDD